MTRYEVYANVISTFLTDVASIEVTPPRDVQLEENKRCWQDGSINIIFEDGTKASIQYSSGHYNKRSHVPGIKVTATEEGTKILESLNNMKHKMSVLQEVFETDMEG